MIRVAHALDLIKLRAKDIYESERCEDLVMAGIARNQVFCLASESNDPLSLFGYDSVWPGVATVWALTSKDLWQKPMIVRELHRFITDTMSTMRYHRVQMYVKCDYVEGQKFAEFLGFKLEGHMIAYGPDKADYFLYGKVK